jgi:hypothetical protein
MRVTLGAVKNAVAVHNSVFSKIAKKLKIPLVCWHKPRSKA